ncbi:MAG: 2-C-methyl-D-erythritol 2,4-cyclodiphosphate synthase, partial [Pseudomonadota bacterium]|nr:2-C-methyl-D-erythritol 2,4-cyclodiphosphate synthase [Pseudomonadota bacterium]
NPHKLAMKQTIATLLELDLSAVNLKATTTEQLGFIGRKEGVATHAVALIQRAHDV